jgi:hypothetical protein
LVDPDIFGGSLSARQIYLGAIKIAGGHDLTLTSNVVLGICAAQVFSQQ